MPGTITSDVEIVQCTPAAIWIAVRDREYCLKRKDFPWFFSVSIDKVFNVEELFPGHLYWPEIDVDLDIQSIENPQAFPLIFQ